jgi:fatty acid desaturase
VAATGSLRLLRYSDWDAILIALSLVYAALLITAPSVLLIGLGLWWTANTVAHNFIHTPFFRARTLNRVYALFLSALMGVPQSLWRARHLRHHSEEHLDDRPPRAGRRV